jgi:uncharacterized protein YkwD
LVVTPTVVNKPSVENPLQGDGIKVVRQQVLDNTTRLRVAAGLRPLKLHSQMNDGAQRHSNAMARNLKLVHSTDLVVQMNRIFDTWRYAGENIGVFGGDLAVLLTALRQSPEHRANMLKPQYRLVGVGATWADDRLWLTIWYKG